VSETSWPLCPKIKSGPHEYEISFLSRYQDTVSLRVFFRGLKDYFEYLSLIIPVYSMIFPQSEVSRTKVINTAKFWGHICAEGRCFYFILNPVSLQHMAGRYNILQNNNNNNRPNSLLRFWCTLVVKYLIHCYAKPYKCIHGSLTL
jgi:hypothetical protein